MVAPGVTMQIAAAIALPGVPAPTAECASIGSSAAGRLTDDVALFEEASNETDAFGAERRDASLHSRGGTSSSLRAMTPRSVRVRCWVSREKRRARVRTPCQSSLPDPK